MMFRNGVKLPGRAVDVVVDWVMNRTCLSGKRDIRVVAYLEIISSEAAHVLHDHSINMSCVDLLVVLWNPGRSWSH